MIRASEQFDRGFADGFGFNAKSGEFWVSRGGDSVQNKQYSDNKLYSDMLEATCGMLETKDLRIGEMERGLSQVDSDDEDIPTVAS